MEQVEVQLGWKALGQVTLDDKGLLSFPPVGTVPGIYKFSVRDDGSTSVYIGETHSLRQRLHKNYRRPPKRATTSIWVNAWLSALLREGKRVDVAVVDETVVAVSGDAFAIDLRRKADRLLVENAAIAIARHAGERLRNKPGVSEPQEDQGGADG